jgi:hypothetical protein
MAADVGTAQFTVWDGESPPHHTFGFHGSAPHGGEPDRRAALFGAYAGGLADAFSGLFDMPAREAWAEVNEILESADYSWAYRRLTSQSLNTYGARLRGAEPAGLGTGRSLYTARGSC